MKYVNTKQLEAKSIRACYFDVDVRKSCSTFSDDAIPAKPLKFNVFGKTGTLRRKILKILCCSRKLDSSWFTEGELMYLRGHDLSRKDMNLLRLLQTIHKLKASVQVLMGDKPERLQKVK